MPESPTTGTVRFGAFELDPATGVLRKHGIRVRLQGQPLRLLLVLLENAGNVVTRETLQQKLWPDTSFGDFDHSLNIAINKIRDALGDAADNPRFVATLPRVGYRFIAPVQSGADPAVPATVGPAHTGIAAVRVPRWLRVTVACVLVVMLTTVLLVLWHPAASADQLESRRVTNDTSLKLPPVLSDGARLYFRTAAATGLRILQLPVSGGEPVLLPIAPPPGTYYHLLDLSPDGQEVLLAMFEFMNTAFDVSYAKAGPLWTVRIVDGSARRIGTLLAREAVYSPDGKQIAFTSGEIRRPAALWVASSDGSNARRLLDSKDVDILVPCWSNDGKRVAFGQRNRVTERWNIWEIGVDGTQLRRVLPEFRANHLPAAWTSDGSLLFNSEGEFWIAHSRRFWQWRQPEPVRLSTGDPVFAVPTRIRQRGTFYTIGTTHLGELQRYNTRSASWEPLLGGISAEGIRYSADGQRVLYVAHPELELWVRRADGSHPVQLTRPPMQADLGRWSPDGKMIAFAGRRGRDQPWSIYLVNADGGSARPACRNDCRGLGPDWMPDGKRLVFQDAFTNDPVYIRLVDLATGEVTRFPGSDGFRSPRVSPDGSALAAQTDVFIDGTLVVYRFSEGVWKRMPLPESGLPSWNGWSRDSKWIWYYNFQLGAIMRCRVRDNRHELILPLRLEEMTGRIGSWFDLTWDDEPMILRRRDVQQVYALDLKHIEKRSN